jgi:CheY-like chemotaxis protein
MLERNRPDILLTDLRMSPMDGFELLRRVREYPEFNSTTIVVVTALSEAEIGARGGVPKGVVVYPKPVPFEKLQGFLEASAMRKQLARA